MDCRIGIIGIIGISIGVGIGIGIGIGICIGIGIGIITFTSPRCLSSLSAATAGYVTVTVLYCTVL